MLDQEDAFGQALPELNEAHDLIREYTVAVS